MKRLHVSVSVPEMGPSVDFYSTLFGQEPSVLKDDYAKWMLDDPRVNFVIEQRGNALGVDHMGIQVEDPEELTEIAERLRAAEQPLQDQPHAVCCYAKSDKAWSRDPQGLSWETFYTFGESTVYGDDTRTAAEGAEATNAACCEPKSETRCC